MSGVAAMGAWRRTVGGVCAAVLVAAVLVGLAPATAQAVEPVSSAEEVAAGQTISGLDAHDGMIAEVGSTYYLYGTRYGCGFNWRQAGTPWCGFGVWTSTDKVRWTFVRNLFDPGSSNSWRNGESWQTTCGILGGGCFNPRMVRRASDGVWILWFNAPDDFRRTRANAYYAMGCQGPAGPCGAGVAGGTTHKPNLYTCHDNGDFSIVYDGGTAYIACTMANQTFSIEPLDRWWTNGTGGGLRNVGRLTAVESPAVFRSGGYLYMTYSDPNCGYCSGTGTSYLYSTTGMLGQWHAGGRISARSCSGQPRSLGWVDGGIVQWIDQWTPSGATNQTIAAVRIEPLTVTTAPRIQALSC